MELASREKNIKELIHFVWHNPHSDFYRKKYELAGIQEKDLADPKILSHLPFLTRQELEAISPNARCFVDQKEVEFAAYTSGTTSQKPLITYFAHIDNFYFDPTLGFDVAKLLIIYPPLTRSFSHTFVQQCRQSHSTPTPIFADHQNLANSAVLAKETCTDAIYSTPTLAALFAPILSPYYDPGSVKLLALSSETLTSSRRQELEKLYPNAKIANLYASSEIGQFILYPCHYIIEQKENLFHVLQPPTLAAELIDNEFVITIGHNRAMPLIRYRTGDFFEEVNRQCPCGKSGLLLKWTGRPDMDRVRVGGIEIKIDDVEQTFAPLKHLTGEYYQVHLYEDKIKPGVGTKLVVEIFDRASAGTILSPEETRQTIKSHLLENWRLSPSATLQNAMETGFISDLEVKLVPQLSFPSTKIRHLVNHFKSG